MRFTRSTRSARRLARWGLAAVGLLAVLLVAGCAGQIQADITVRSDGTWTGESRVVLPRPPVALPGWQRDLEARLRDTVANRLDGRSIQAGVSPLSEEQGGAVYDLALSGQDVGAVADLLADKEAAVEWLGGPVRLEVSGQVTAGQELELALPASPATGYGWRLEPAGEVTLALTAPIDSRQIEPGMGTLARQVLRLRAGQSGAATLRLVYARPWEGDARPTREFSLRGPGLDLAGLLAALSLRPPTEPDPLPAPVTDGEPGSTAAEPQLVPASYNWCSLGGCTPVRDQGACGSCWAFATVGAMELNVKYRQGGNVNLSEQYLVSCNRNDWGCGGGWWAHDYHWNTFYAPETKAGAVLESDFPYVAADVSCGGPYLHPHRLSAWSHVNPANPNAVPSPDAIKQAIYSHGPVAVAICVGSAFNAYGGGVFSTDESAACGTVNHGVVLVGWDDADRTWILRNSWNTGWGEDGYMRIRWGTSRVGYGASYVSYSWVPNYDNRLYLPYVIKRAR